jgi:GGDEF domain-containing protein
VSALNESTVDDGLTPEDVLDLADQRLYACKKAGRNCVMSMLTRASRPRSLSEMNL